MVLSINLKRLTKFTQFESQISNLRKDLETKNAQIIAFELRVEELEKENNAYKKKQEKKIKDLENTNRQKFTKQNNSKATITKKSSIQCENVNTQQHQDRA